MSNQSAPIAQPETVEEIATTLQWLAANMLGMNRGQLRTACYQLRNLNHRLFAMQAADAGSAPRRSES